MASKKRGKQKPEPKLVSKAVDPLPKGTKVRVLNDAQAQEMIEKLSIYKEGLLDQIKVQKARIISLEGRLTK